MIDTDILGQEYEKEFREYLLTLAKIDRIDAIRDLGICLHCGEDLGDPPAEKCYCLADD